MSQIQVRDAMNNPIVGINYRISLGINPQENAIYDNYTDQQGNSGWPIPFWPSNQEYTLYFNVANVNPRFGSTSYRVPAGWNTDIQVSLSTNFPDAPSRQSVLNGSITFQGLYIALDLFNGVLTPWFEDALICCSPKDRQTVYAAKHLLGDTHCIIGFYNGGPIYDEPNQPYQGMMAPDFQSSPQNFLALFEEVRINGFIPMVFLDEPSGYGNISHQLGIVLSTLRESQYRDLRQDCMILPGWDGIWYGWTYDQINVFGQYARSLCPNCILGIESSKSHLGNSKADWAPGGALQNYDFWLHECDSPPNTAVLWQNMARLLGPKYKRAVDQGGDDPGAPFPAGSGEDYTSTGNPRGPYGIWEFEYDEFNCVHNNLPTDVVVQHRNYIKSVGVVNCG